MSRVKYKLIQLVSTALIKLSAFRNPKKVWLSLGDSLTKPYAYQLLSNKYKGYSVANNSVGGSAIADNGAWESLCKRIKKLNNENKNEVELITILGGTNDFGFNIEIGELDTYNSKEFIGALENVILFLKKNFQNAEIVLMSAPKRNNKFGEEVNERGYSIQDYSNAMESVSKKHKTKFVNICNESGIEVSNLKKFTLDGVHLNWKGHKKVAELLDAC